MSKVKVAVLAGGISSEREISILGGQCVANALRDDGYEVVVSDISPDDLKILDDKSIDVFFICLHGKFGEDGKLQRILEDRGLCYTHSDSFASASAMDKITAKECFTKAGVQCPASVRFNDSLKAEQLCKQVPSATGKYVAKPVSDGSSFGVEIVTGAQEAIERCRANKNISADYMIEEFIPGRELTVGVFDGHALPVMEIRPKVGFYDYHAKYVADNTQYLFDTLDDEKLIRQISDDAVKCFECLSCRGVARVDFILAENGTTYALEINTVPGMTEHSCIPKAAAKIGISMPELCGEIVNRAISEFNKIGKTAVREIRAGGKTKKENQAEQKAV